MRSDDLAPLFTQQPPASVGFRQGTILTWDSITAENTVEVGGTVFTDLPILNTSEALLIQPGDVVGLEVVGGGGAQTMYIKGRITIPGTPQAASALALIANQIVAASNAEFGTTSSGTFGDLEDTDVGPAVTVTIRSSGMALVWWGCDFGFTGAFEADSTSSSSVAVSGATTRAASASWALSFLADITGGSQIDFRLSASQFHLFEDLNAGSNTFTMKYRTPTAGGDDPDTVFFGERRLAVLAL